jgi:peptidoglycan/LPS O-acetylase OafA/YrhL
VSPTTELSPPIASDRTVGRVLELDGLRGLAILMVVVWHYFISAPELEGRLHWMLVPFSQTWSGVDLFFVLSGFLISNILLNVRSSTHFFTTFYVRRFFRIVPIYFVLLLLAMVMRHYLPEMFSGYEIIPQWAYFLFVPNIAMAMVYSHGAGILGISWSLGVEEQFYLLLPACVRGLTERALYRAALCAIPAAVLLRSACLNNLFALQYQMPCRIDALALGILCGAVLKNQRLRQTFSERRLMILAVLFVGFGALAIFDLNPLTSRIAAVFGLTWIAMLYAALLLTALLAPSSLVARISRNPALREMGQLAYFVYLFHDLIHQLVYRYVGVGPIAGLLSITTVILLAKVSWRLFEEPLIRKGHSWRYSQPGNGSSKGGRPNESYG